MRFEGQTLLVTGGAGFIGSNLVRLLLGETRAAVVNLDLLTYAGCRASLEGLPGTPRHAFVQGDVRDHRLVEQLLDRHRPDAVLHLAAESHVDRSIESPAPFVSTNVLGTATLLEACRAYWAGLGSAERDRFRFLHVSTDEVYGSLPVSESPTREGSAYAPNSPYAASKAGSDHLVRAYHQTYGLPTITTNSTNNYGPRQHPEKLIPLMTLRAIAREPMPLYGDGLQTRDWLHVDDQCRALMVLLAEGKPGEQYNVGAEDERTNRETVHLIAEAVDKLLGLPAGATAGLITHVEDRPGHDRRYALDAEKTRTLGWRPKVEFADGLVRLIDWYSTNQDWVAAIRRPQSTEVPRG